jgi:hypothetical protein
LEKSNDIQKTDLIEILKVTFTNSSTNDYKNNFDASKTLTYIFNNLYINSKNKKLLIDKKCVEIIAKCFV